MGKNKNYPKKEPGTPPGGQPKPGKRKRMDEKRENRNRIISRPSSLLVLLIIGLAIYFVANS